MDTQDEKLKQQIEEELNKSYTVKFTKRQWVTIYNLLAADGRNPRLYSLGDAKIVNEICDQIQSVADLDSLKRITKPEEGVITNG